MQIVAVDIGNSSTKLAVEHAAADVRWSWETVLRGANGMTPTADVIEQLDSDRVIWSVSSVNQTRATTLQHWINEHRPGDRFHLISPDEVDLKTAVVSRERLGRDRLIAAWSALQLNETGPLIVIDAGTAVTVDAVSAEPCFLGGMIFPGAVTMLRTLSEQTAALPDLSETRSSDRLHVQRLGQIGRSTEEAILYGVYQTQVCTLRSVVKKMASELGDHPEVFITGGGIVELLEWLPEEWEHVPDLVLRGALEIGRRT